MEETLNDEEKDEKINGNKSKDNDKDKNYFPIKSDEEKIVGIISLNVNRFQCHNNEINFDPKNNA